MTPFEAARIRMVSLPETYGDLGVLQCIRKIYEEEGLRSLYIGLAAILGKQIPYTALSLCTFELVSKYLYTNILGVGVSMISNPAVGSTLKLNEEVTCTFGDTLITSAATAAVTMDSVISLQRFSVTFFAATLAGCVGAIVSQPGDTLLSVINKRSKEILQTRVETSSSTTSQADFSALELMANTAKELGFRGLFAGFKARLAHVMIIVVIQLIIYDFLKNQIGAWLG